MSQEKIDKRKQNKGELLHQTKKAMRRVTIIVAVVLVLAGAFACVVTYNRAYDKGYNKGGEDTAKSYAALFGGSDTADETKADETKADETKADETKADETKADETKADETKADETKADETKADETEAE